MLELKRIKAFTAEAIPATPNRTMLELKQQLKAAQAKTEAGSQSHHAGIETRFSQVASHVDANSQSHHAGIETSLEQCQEAQGKGSQSHHAGIETKETFSLLFEFLQAPNRTMLELKRYL